MLEFRGKRATAPTAAEAEEIAIRALGFLAAEPDRLARFLALSGLAPESLREMAGTPAFQAAVMDHLIGDESMLLVFADEARLPPERIAAAAALLSGGNGD
ncbi:MAG: DUF3572 domain-containing protein [Hyphomicrobiaceae bacterium]